MHISKLEKLLLAALEKISRLETENDALRQNAASAAGSSSFSPAFGQHGLPRFPLADLQLATNSFSIENKLGGGGFGDVYKGTLLKTQVAVKKLDQNRNQGHKEFKAELTSLSRFRHPNIVTILGYAEEGEECCLVYEFLVNGSLRDRLDKKNGTPPLTWEQRESIALNVALGMSYLQNADPERPLFHLDLKSANILLDVNFQPKVSDFGLTRRAVLGSDSNSYWISSKVHGDLSYICPEYLKGGGIVSRKTDVYSYGCVLIELLSGKCFTVALLYNIRQVFSTNRDLVQDLDTSLEWTDEMSKRAKQLAELANRCTNEFRQARPSFLKIVSRLTDFAS